MTAQIRDARSRLTWSWPTPAGTAWARPSTQPTPRRRIDLERGGEDRHGPSAGAADHGGGGAPNTARVSARAGPTALRWERGWERGGSKSGPSVAVGVRLCPFGNLALCREFPIRTGDAGPLGPPSTEPKVRGSNPLGRAAETALESQILRRDLSARDARWERVGTWPAPLYFRLGVP